MAKIEVRHTIIEAIEIPNCFCGREPAIGTERALGDNRYKQLTWLECPHCHAHSHKHAFDSNSVNSRYEAILKATEEWNALFEREGE